MSRSIPPVLRALLVLVAALLTVPGGVTHAQGVDLEVAGSSTVWFSDAWELKPEYSSPDSVFLMHRELIGTSFVYSESTELGHMDLTAAMDDFSRAVTETFDPGSTQQLLSGMSGGTTGWRLYTAAVAGVPVAVVMTTDVSVLPGTLVQSMLLAPAGSMDIALDETKTIAVDSVPTAIARLDADLIVNAIEADIAGPAPAANAVIIDGVDYRQLDAASGCDRIGWAITDPAQLPVTEADIEQRGACAGGVSYVAKCGTVPGERDNQRYIACEVTTLVTSGPQEFAFDMFELFEADGTSEYIDLGMSFGNDRLFESGPVPEGATVTGTAPFAIAVTATEPLLLEIRPPTLPAGTEPAVIVIEGPLKELAAIG